VAHLDHGVVGPEAAAQIVAQHHLAGMFQQGHQDTERLFLQPDLVTVLAQFGGAHVELEFPEADEAHSAKRPGCQDGFPSCLLGRRITGIGLAA